MKAIYYKHYGSPKNIELKEVPKPKPKENELLVKVFAASLNSWDWDLLTGQPKLFRFWGFFKPSHNILGGDIAGVIEQVGSKVSKFKPGDRVFGDLSNCGWGGFAEYVCADENSVISKPEFLDYEEAAAFPQAAVIALQGIKEYGKVKKGQSVLINGAGGGVGTFAIQLAKHYGAEVTAVDSLDKFEIMKSAGADYLIDYKKNNFVENEIKYDYILDAAGYHSILDYNNSLSNKGKYVIVGGAVNLIIKAALFGKLITLFTNKKINVLVHKPNNELAYLANLCKSGNIKPFIHKIYSLEKTYEAFQDLGDGKVKGKAVIKIQ